MSTRTIPEIRAIFEDRGCTVEVRDNGHSYRAGGDVFIYSPELGEISRDTGLSFTEADFAGFTGTGYDGRGRHYDVFLITPGEYVRATPAEFANAAEDKRLAFGAEHKSCSNRTLFVDRAELARSGLADMAGAFEALGL